MVRPHAAPCPKEGSKHAPSAEGCATAVLLLPHTVNLTVHCGPQHSPKYAPNLMTQGEVEMRSYAITDDMKKGSVEALFDLMAERMVDFAGECGESMHTPEGGEAPILGFCFSFPVDQSALDHGTLIRWTKGAL